MPKHISIVGQRFGKLTVIGKSEQKRKWLCVCDCGKECHTNGADMKAGKVSSCGCLKKAQLAERNKSNATHGMFGTKEYAAWGAMIQRCENPLAASYARYGGRGITVSECWRSSFSTFLSDMGCAPADMSLERVDVHGNYEPSNCIWTDAVGQANNRTNNRTIVHNAESMNLSQWARRAGLNVDTLKVRLDKLGWDMEKAITAPLKNSRK